MRLLDRKTIYDTSITMDDNCLIEIDMGKRYEVSLAKRFSRLNKDNELLDLLQTFNSRITKVDTDVQQYIVDYDYFKDFDGNQSRLGFSSLSTGERLFTICFIANKLKEHIIVCREITQLDMPHLRMFFKLWANSRYIDVIIPSNLMEFQIKELYKRYREK